MPKRTFSRQNNPRDGSLKHRQFASIGRHQIAAKTQTLANTMMDDDPHPLL
jgi:hypothetical protein